MVRCLHKQHYLFPVEVIFCLRLSWNILAVMRMSFIHSTIFRVCYLLFFITGSHTNDIVVNSSVESNWTSLMFIIPVKIPRNAIWKSCRLNTIYYCSHAFVSYSSSPDRAVEIRGRNNIQALEPSIEAFRMIKLSACHECQKLLGPVLRDHNLFAYRDGFCASHDYHYFVFGYGLNLWTPRDYYERITDYTDGKALNFIMAHYSPKCKANIIMELGFGKGKLTVSDHFTSFQPERPGLPYILKVGYQWTPKVPYENPEDFITFAWFKKNVMCADQPWICGEPKTKMKKTRKLWRRYFGKRPRFPEKQ